ncbi:HlyD family secretion protein [Spirochaeta isovalerica]|uniref:HlyD family secretion protein n=1 Tax=Spirochaeta isovalerica TaxID=150 RepID=A0A841R858_9SPIO|nr:HlyD family efflux transporter periplasmic adaptor subunit [Spirochaeta isovalerica]MBB6479377.1 HlyD family secretion protein [Spirochaeta isovalerica]
MIKKMTLLIFGILILSCTAADEEEVYIGRMEADTLVISAQAAGELLELAVREGDQVEKGQIIGRIDSEGLSIQKRQQLAGLNALASQKESALLQIDQARVQLNLNRETLGKTEKLLSMGGAAEQKRDELATQVSVGESSLRILQSQYNLILAQEAELYAGIDMTDLAIEKSSVEAPVSGTILNRYHSPGELVARGTPLLEMADLSVLDLYVYLPLRKLTEVKVGQSAHIEVSGASQTYSGTLSWIASEGEFTPKTILTKETRDTLVYEVKIRVENPSGELKIGMPADVTF